MNIGRWNFLKLLLYFLKKILRSSYVRCWLLNFYTLENGSTFSKHQANLSAFSIVFCFPVQDQHMRVFYLHHTSYFWCHVFTFLLQWKSNELDFHGIQYSSSCDWRWRGSSSTDMMTANIDDQVHLELWRTIHAQMSGPSIKGRKCVGIGR